MKLFFTSLITILLILSCKNENKDKIENNIPIETKIGTKPENILDDKNFDLYEKFSAEKNKVIAQLKSLNPTESNKLYEKFEKIHIQFMVQITELEINTLDKFYNEDSESIKNIKNLNEKIKEYNLRFKEVGEGFVEITTESDFLYNIFKDYVTEDYKEYLLINSIENKDVYIADAGLVISFSQLGDRIISWENFINKYPNSTLRNMVIKIIKEYQSNYILGLDNTPTREINYGENKTVVLFIYPENLKEYERFQKKYPNSPTNKLINIFKTNFKNENFNDMFIKEQEKLK